MKSLKPNLVSIDQKVFSRQAFENRPIPLKLYIAYSKLQSAVELQRDNIKLDPVSLSSILVSATALSTLLRRLRFPLDFQATNKQPAEQHLSTDRQEILHA